MNQVCWENSRQAKLKLQGGRQRGNLSGPESQTTGRRLPQPHLQQAQLSGGRMFNSSCEIPHQSSSSFSLENCFRHRTRVRFDFETFFFLWLLVFSSTEESRAAETWTEKMWNQIPGNVESHNWNSAYAQRHKTCMNNILFYSDWSLPVTPTVSCQWTSAESMLVLAPHWDSNIKGETAERKMNTLTACTHSTQFITQYFLLNSRKVINDFVYKAHMKNKEFHNTE